MQSGATVALRSQSSGKTVLSSCKLSTSAIAGVAAPFDPTKTVLILQALAPEMFLWLSSKKTMSSGFRLGIFKPICSRASSNACN